MSQVDVNHNMIDIEGYIRVCDGGWELLYYP